MTAQVQPADAYRACVDPLHRNVWPIRVGDDDTVVGYLTEHITVNLDGAQPPIVDWSWRFNEAEAQRLSVAEYMWESPLRYPGHEEALTIFADMHRLAAATQVLLATLRGRRAR